MGTPFKEVNAAFLARIEQNEWDLLKDIAYLERDWLEFMKMAIARFMFPRVSLELDNVGFTTILVKIINCKNTLFQQIKQINSLKKHLKKASSTILSTIHKKNILFFA